MATPQAEIIDLNAERDAAEYTDRQLAELYETVGATKVIDQMANALVAQRVRGCQHIRDRKLWAAAKSESFRDFMDNHPRSPMSYDRFNRAERLLESEGEVMFDLLNSLNIPQSARKLLKGEIEIDGNELRVGDQRVRTDDQAAILNLITTQHARLVQQEKSIQQKDKKLKKGEEDFEKLKREVRVANPTGTPTGQALLTAAGALTQLCEALDSAPPEEKHALKDQIFDLMRAKQLDLSVALGDLSKDEAKLAGALDDLISDDEAATLES